MIQLKRAIVWVAPLLIVLAGMMILFMENYQEVTEAPHEEWSREIQIGTTPSLKEPSISRLKNDELSISFLTEKGVQQKIYDKNYNLVTQNNYDIPVDKFTSIFMSKDRLLYSDYYSIYDEKTGEKISDINGFYPLGDQVVYRKGNELYQLQTDNLESTFIMKLQDENISVHTYRSKDGNYIITHKVNDKGNHLNFYQMNESNAQKIGTSDFLIKGTEELNDLQFSIQDGNYHILANTLQKQSMSGKLTNFYYYSKTPLGENPDLHPLQFQDPFGKGKLRELSDIEMKQEGNRVFLLFKAFGKTQTRFKKPSQFNVYQATIQNGNTKEVLRLSNTPDSSLQPAWINSETVLWIDQGSNDKNQLYLSSGNKTIIEKADKMTIETFIQTLGKTMGMLSYSIFAILITLIWFIWPLIFLAIIMFANSRAMDRDHSWVFYTGAVIYMIAAITLKDRLFTNALMDRAPEYLSFPGSSFIYLLGFALLTYTILKYGAQLRDWSTSIQLTYFVGIHIVFMTIFFGPYLL